MMQLSTWKWLEPDLCRRKGVSIMDYAPYNTRYSYWYEILWWLAEILKEQHIRKTDRNEVPVIIYNEIGKDQV